MMVRASFEPRCGVEPFLESIARINSELECEVTSYLINESTIETWWSHARGLDVDCPGYWLLLARLAEAALLCAGNYADNCEYQAAGDFLVNPREILIHQRGYGRSTTKNRHGSLSDQFGLKGVQRHDSIRRFSTGMCLEIIKFPLLPHMTRVLKTSERISSEYLQRLEEGQCRIADTLAFLAAWCVFDSAELWRRLQESSARERDFAESHLCRFETDTFYRIGEDVRLSLVQPDYWSTFLACSPACGKKLMGKSPATAMALVETPA